MKTGWPDCKFSHYRYSLEGPPEEGPYAIINIGTWRVHTAKAIARELRQGGFTVKVRGRGPRWHYARHLTDSLPLDLATHASVYIVHPDSISVKVTTPKRVGKLIGDPIH
jgi:hypothetical protein